MKKARIMIAGIAISVFLLSFVNNAGSEKKIGAQTWALTNLETTTFRNGDAIPEVRTEEEWVKAGDNGQPAWCYYDNDPVNGKKYGKLYNWFAVSSPKGLAPKGWHVPNDNEWATLTTYLGGEPVSGKTMKAGAGWKDDGNGTNKSGFTGLPGGCRYFFGTFNHLGNRGYWWSSTEGKISIDANRGLTSNKGYVNGFDYDGRCGFSVRCVRD